VKPFVTLFIITVTALLFWWNQTDNNIIASSQLTEPHYVDTFIRDFTLTAMDEKGVPGFTLKASYMEHYHDDDNSLITRPVFHLLQADAEWIITADHGEINASHNWIKLQGNVVLQQKNAADPFQLKTELLTVDTNKQIAKSNQAVQILRGQLHLKSRGMILNNKTGQLELLAKVKGVYATAH